MSYAGHIKALFVLGLPLVGGHVAQFAITLTDTVMLGWYGVEELAAVTLAGSYFFVLFLLGAGFGSAVMPLVASASAAEDEASIRRYTRMGLWLSVLFSTLIMPLFIWSGPILRTLGQEEIVATKAAAYLLIAGWGMYPALLVWVLKSYLAALERTQIVLWITVLAAVVNGLVNYVLIFGHLGAPEMGIAGAAVASIATQVVSLGAVLIYALMVLPQHNLLQRFWRPDWEMLKQVFRLGMPIGFTSLAESSLFSATAVMMGWLGAVPLAAHGIALQLAAVAFMLHLGLSNAATVRAGNAAGRKDRLHLKRGALVAHLMSLAIAAVGITLFLVIPDPLMSLFLERDNPARNEILAIGAGLLVVAALFQTADGAQVIALGVLRGVQDTTIPMIIAVLSYWVIGLPMSYVLGFVVGWGGIGVWLGLVGGLSAAAGLLMIRFWTGGVRRVPEA